MKKEKLNEAIELLEKIIAKEKKLKNAMAEIASTEQSKNTWKNMKSASEKYAIQALVILKAENERFEDILDKIKNWCKAYPLEVFQKPDLKKAHKVLTDAGMTLDAISADAMRHVLEGVQKIIEDAEND